MPSKVFLEITNVCNLACSFCHGTRRAPRFMSVDDFRTAAEKVRGFADYLYFHLMGEPLLHPDIDEFFNIAGDLGFKVIITTNGTLLDELAPLVENNPSLFKVSISLHSYEANELGNFDDYLNSCFSFCESAAKNGIISVMRLWNLGGEDKRNDEIIRRMHEYFDRGDGQWREIYSGYKIRDKIFLEWGQKFDWPDTEADFCGDSHSCYGLRDQIGILSDGTVVPCCLDADGAIALGNIFTEELDEILASPRAAALKRSFETKKVTEPLCQRCGYAKMKAYK